MKIVHARDDNWKKDHPTGNIAFQHLLKGDPESPDNFMYILGRQDADFEMPRHRHNFDQIRLPICGDMNIGRGIILREGEVGYFPEGLPYGPQSDPLGKTAPGERLQLVLQFGGASGYGFMSIEQRRKAWSELQEFGKFVGPNFHWADGRVEWGLNPVWERVFGVKLKYPRSRYKAPVIADPRFFNWLAIADAPGVEHQYLGAFSERGVWMEMIRIAPGAEWTSRDALARRLLVVLDGEGTAGSEALYRLTALQCDPGETLYLSSKEGMRLFLIGLPPVTLPAMESQEYDFEETLPEEAPAREAAE